MIFSLCPPFLSPISLSSPSVLLSLVFFQSSVYPQPLLLPEKQTSLTEVIVSWGGDVFGGRVQFERNLVLI